MHIGTPGKCAPSNGPPISDLQLGKQLLLGALPQPPAPSWAPLVWHRGKKPPKECHRPPSGVSVFGCGHTGAQRLRAGRGMEGVPVPTLKAWVPATATLNPPQSFYPSSGPGATPKCRFDFPRAPGAALSLLFPGLVLPQPPSGFLIAGLGRLPDSPTVQQAHYNFCSECSASLSCCVLF